MAEWRKNNPEKNKHAYRRDKLKKDFGLTIEQYDSMLASQNGVCAICGKCEKGKRLAVDHCHTTGKIRGLLCQRCNRGLGYFKDNTESLTRAVGYLTNAS